MKHTSTPLSLVIISLTATAILVTGSGLAAIKVTAPPQLMLDENDAKNPADKRKTAAAAVSQLTVGQVIFSRGSQVVAEIESGAVAEEYFLVLDSLFRRKGMARVVRPLQSDTYLLKGVGASLTEGDRLAREGERQAMARVLRQKQAGGYRAFLTRFPNSAYRARVARELFRLQMASEYPARPGSSITGQLRLAESVDRPIPLNDVQVVLDRFVIGATGEGGQYRIDGIPQLEQPVTVKMKIKDPKFRIEKELTVDLPADAAAELTLDLPVLLTPTTLSGRVLDVDGEPVAGAEVWTSPYTLEFLTDEDGGYRISRRKDLGDTAVGDHPLFGGEYQIYASRSGYSVERITLSAKSFTDNVAPPIRLSLQDTRNEPVPDLDLVLRSHLQIDPAAMVSPQGAGPLLNP